MMLNELLIAWLVVILPQYQFNKPNVTCLWDPSTPEEWVLEYKLINEYENGDTEIVYTTTECSAPFVLEWQRPVRCYVVPVGLQGRTVWESISEPSERVVWNQLWARIDTNPFGEVALFWDDVGGTVTVYSTTILPPLWEKEAEVAPELNWWWENTNEERKYYKVMVRSE